MNTVEIVAWCVGLFFLGLYSWRIASYMVHILLYMCTSKPKRGGRITFDAFSDIFVPNNFVRFKQFRNSIFVNPKMISETMDLNLFEKYQFHAGLVKVNEINRWMTPIDYFRVYKKLKDYKVMTQEEHCNEFMYHSSLVSFPSLTREEYNQLKLEMKG